MKRKQIGYLFFIPALLWMLLIFILSAMPEDVSKEQSDYVSIRLQRLIVATLSGNEDEALDEWEEWAAASPVYSVRKMAHVFEYTVLCVFLYIGFAGLEHARRRAFLLTILYACSDEFHQLFVPGRGALLVDVAIDSIGAGVGLLLILVFGRWILNSKTTLLNRAQGMNGKPMP